MLEDLKNLKMLVDSDHAASGYQTTSQYRKMLSDVIQEIIELNESKLSDNNNN